MDLSIIIINWNSAEYVRKCLGSLFENCKGMDFEVIVVDNGSFDACQRIITDEFPKVRFLQSSENLGFARANNFGAERAEGEFLLFLNPDTEVIDNAIGGMLSFMKSLPDAAVLGCRLLNSDKSFQTSCVQAFPTILNQVFDSDMINKRLPAFTTGKVEDSIKGPAKVQMVSGACMMVRKKIFEEVGNFSPEYFMYTEDLDLCYKAHQAGYSNYYTGAFSVIHHGGGSSYQRKETSYANVQMRESIFKFFRKTRGRFYAGVYKKAMLLNGIMRFCVLSCAFAVSLLIGREAKYRPSLIKWQGIIRWTIGIEKWAR
jgi:N-acetylglucosaminyl-diphospho-decaprenol L-rhamnosyltransferase